MLNHMTIQGRLTRDPELRYTQGGTALAKFTVAWSEKYKETENKLFLDCTAWGKTAELIGDKFHKGDQILLEGQLRTETWQNDAGENRSKIAMNVDRMHFVGSAGGNSAQTAAAIPGVEVPIDDNSLPF